MMISYFTSLAIVLTLHTRIGLMCTGSRDGGRRVPINLGRRSKIPELNIEHHAWSEKLLII